MKEEIFREVPGYHGRYMVSNKGRVFSELHNKMLSPGKNKDGYLFVNLTKRKNGNIRHWSIHRLVAVAFIPNPDNLPQINHKDEDKTNNCVENLEWCTAEYNCNYGTRNERAGNRKRNGKLSKPVLQYTLDGKFIKEWPSAIEITRQLGFNQGGISRCCLGQVDKVYGFIWVYKNEG